MSKLMNLFLCVVAIAGNANAITEEDKTAFNNAITPFIIECSEKHGISQDDVTAAKQAGTASGLPPCFLACVLKKAAIINEKGIYEVDVVIPKLNELIKNKDDLAHLEGVAKKCASVNDQAVSDGEAGCDRAKLLFTCLRQHKGEITL